MKDSVVAAVVVAVVMLLFLVLLPFLLIAVLYTFITIYAITKGTTFDSASVNVGVIFAGIGVLVAMLFCLLALAVWGIDKTLGPLRRRTADEA